MDFVLTEEQRIFQDSVRGFAQRHLAEGALERAHNPAFPRDVARLMAENGLLGITVPDSEGGLGGTLMDAVIAIEQVALVCPRSADVVQAGNFGPIRTFAEYGSEDQKKRYLKPLLEGEKVISLGMSEPDAGSAVTDLKTTAEPDGEGYRLSGSKIFGTHSGEADVYLIYCRFGPGVSGIGSVLVERGVAGFEVGQPSQFMGGEEWCQLYFDQCYIPPENVLLGPGGFKKQMSGFNVERIGNAARSLAVGRHAYNIAREHAQTRKQFDRRLCEFQGLQWKFADMAVKLEAAQLLLYKAASAADNDLPSAFDTAVAKLTCNQAGFEVSNEAMQVMGATGYSDECLVEYCMRRTRGWMIAGGSTEILKNRIAESVFGERFPQRPNK
ncbi:acyl-CoA dehydrogenase family protein [Fodinicurvata halophila]|uniref:Acyl-CoA dehydrogenase family protein n=1 Tax=Fodinicurvata halophila TaxID=1419723 RepID=A0ABV8USE5_9PROT